MIRNIRILYIHNFLVDFRIQDAFRPIYFAQITGSYTLAMAVFSVQWITSALADIPTGVLSDKMGRKFTIVLASVCSTIGITTSAFSTHSAGLFLGSIFFGLSECLFNGNNNALLYESLKSSGQEGRFHHYQGRTSSMFQLALGLSAVCASFLTGHGLRFLFILGIIPQALSIIVGLLFEEPRAHMAAPQKSLRHLKDACTKIYGNTHLLLLLIAQAISRADEAKFQFQTIFINTLWPTWALGIYRAMDNALCFFGFWFSGRIVDRFKETYVLAVQQAYGLVSQTIGLILSNVMSPLLFMSGAILVGPGSVARDHLLQKEFTDEQRATMGSVASFAGSIVYAIVAFCIGIIADHFGLVAGVRGATSASSHRPVRIADAITDARLFGDNYESIRTRHAPLHAAIFPKIRSAKVFCHQHRHRLP
jgi:MFS family permease